MESNKKNVYIFIFLGVKKVLLFNAQEIEIRESLNAAYSFRESTKRKKNNIVMLFVRNKKQKTSKNVLWNFYQRALIFNCFES